MVECLGESHYLFLSSTKEFREKEYCKAIGDDQMEFSNFHL